MTMSDELYPHPDARFSRKRRELAPDISTSFAAFSKQVFAEGALSVRTKQLIAVAVAHVTQCPIASGAMFEARFTPAHRKRRSWKPSGSLRKCAPAQVSPTR